MFVTKPVWLCDASHLSPGRREVQPSRKEALKRIGGGWHWRMRVAASCVVSPPCVLKKVCTALGRLANVLHVTMWWSSRSTNPKNYIFSECSLSLLSYINRHWSPFVTFLPKTHGLPMPGSLSEKFSSLHRSAFHKRPATLICVISPSINLLSVTMCVIGPLPLIAYEGFN